VGCELFVKGNMNKLGRDEIKKRGARGKFPICNYTEETELLSSARIKHY